MEINDSLTVSQRVEETFIHRKLCVFVFHMICFYEEIIKILVIKKLKDNASLFVMVKNINMRFPSVFKGNIDADPSQQDPVLWLQ